MTKLFPEAPMKSALKSTFIPGWGQLSNNRPSGYLAVAGVLASTGTLVATQSALSDAEDELDKLAKTDISRGPPIRRKELQRLSDAYDEAKGDVDKKRNRRNAAVIVLGAVWTANIVDAFIESHILVKSRRETVQKMEQTVRFEATPDLRGVVMRVRF